MGTTESKEQSMHDQNYTENSHNNTQNMSTFQKWEDISGPSSAFKDQDYEEDKYAEKTQTSGDGDPESSTYRGSNQDTPYQKAKHKKRVFAAMTRRVINNKENRKDRANKMKNDTYRYDKNTGHMKYAKNVDPDGIEWVKKEEIVENRVVSTKPYGTKHPSGKMFGPGSQSRSRLFKARTGVLTYLPPKALATILSYDMNSYRKYLSVCASWHVGITEAFDQYFNRIENEFVLKYQEHLLFTESFTSASAIKFCGKRGLRVDRVLVCDILKFKPQLNRTLTIGYTFNYHGEPKNK